MKTGPYYIYALGDPRDGEIYYVGVTRDPERRYCKHKLTALVKKNITPVMVILAVTDDANDARKIEVETIKQLSKKYKLINQTPHARGPWYGFGQDAVLHRFPV